MPLFARAAPWRASSDVADQSFERPAKSAAAWIARQREPQAGDGAHEGPEGDALGAGLALDLFARGVARVEANELAPSLALGGVFTSFSTGSIRRRAGLGTSYNRRQLLDASVAQSQGRFACRRARRACASVTAYAGSILADKPASALVVRVEDSRSDRAEHGVNFPSAAPPQIVELQRRS